jgi:cell division protein FtsL
MLHSDGVYGTCCTAIAMSDGVLIHMLHSDVCADTHACTAIRARLYTNCTVTLLAMQPVTAASAAKHIFTLRLSAQYELRAKKSDWGKLRLDENLTGEKVRLRTSQTR